MIVERKIKIKTIVTEKFKIDIENSINENIKQIDEEMNYLDQRYKKIITELTIKASPQVQSIREQLEWEKKKRDEVKVGLLDQAKKLKDLVIGSEILQGETTGPVDVEKGACWETLNNSEIVLKDGIVVEIR